MKKLSLILMLFISGLNLVQAQNNSKDIDAYVYLIMGKVAKIEIPSTKQLFFFGRRFDQFGKEVGKGVWFLCTDPKMATEIESITKDGDTAIMVGAELPPYQLFTPRQWKRMSRKLKKVFPLEAHEKLNEVNCVVLSSVYKYIGGPLGTIVSQGNSTTTTTNSDYKLGTIDGVEYVMQTSTGFKWKTQVSNGVRYIWARTPAGKVDWVKFEGTF